MNVTSGRALADSPVTDAMVDEFVDQQTRAFQRFLRERIASRVSAEILTEEILERMERVGEEMDRRTEVFAMVVSAIAELTFGLGETNTVSLEKSQSLTGKNAVDATNQIATRIQKNEIRNKEAKRELISSIDLVSSSVVGSALYPGANTFASQLKYCRDKSYILAFKESGNHYRYPSFQIDFAGQRIWPAVKRANTMMKAASSPWSVLDWWVNPNPFLDGEATPISTVGVSDDADRLVLDEAEIALLISTQFGHDTF